MAWDNGVLVNAGWINPKMNNGFQKRLNDPQRFFVVKPASPVGPPNRHERLKAKAIARKKGRTA